MSYLSHRMKSLAGNVTATFLQEIFSFKTKGALFLGESKNGFVIPDHMDSLPPIKRKI